jgi:hypothetical protein
MTRLFKLMNVRLLTLGGAKASTMGPIAGEQFEDFLVEYDGS